jgi:glycosyltransferase involved in cell wall biosynthesis
MARILLLSSYEPPPDGIAKHSSQLVEAWDRDGHSVLVVSPGREADFDRSERVGSHSEVTRGLRLLPRRRVWEGIVRFEPDVVVVQFAVAALNVYFWPVRHLCKKLRARGVPIVVAFHEPDREYNLLGFATRHLYQSIARVTDVPVVFSPSGRQALQENNLFVDVVEATHGTKGVASISDDEIDNVRKIYQIRKPLVLTLGFTNFDKGADILIGAVESIATARGNDVQFLVAGAPRRRHGLFRVMEWRDISCQRRLVEQANKLSGVDISFSDYVADENVAPLLHVADVVVLPYRTITQSGVANWALSSQSVIVCSDLPGLRSDLGDAALYVPVGDSAALAAQIVELLDDDAKPRRSRMRQLSGERATLQTYAKTAADILTAGLLGHT